MAARTIAVVGPTASGKTALAVGVAERLGDAELVNADSRQLLRGLRIGINAPTGAELRGVACHLLGVADPGARFSVADWLKLARPCLAQLMGRGRRAIVVGGTGLYVTALLDGYDLAGVPPDSVRRRQRDQQASTDEGLAELAAELALRDPGAAATLDLRNPRRVVRALEILDSRGPGAAAAQRHPLTSDAQWIGVSVEPLLHRRLIAERSHRMFDEGLVAEVAAALARGVDPGALDAAGIGYREGIAFIEGRLSESEAIAEITRRTLRYAKAQRTWFRRETRIRWIPWHREEDAPGLVDVAMTALER